MISHRFFVGLRGYRTHRLMRDISIIKWTNVVCR